MVGKMMPCFRQDFWGKANGIGHLEEMTWCGHMANEPGNFDLPFGWSRFGRKGAREKPQGGQDPAND